MGTDGGVKEQNLDGTIGAGSEKESWQRKTWSLTGLRAL
jgi:hypothetical protein